jgi:malate synthase
MGAEGVELRGPVEGRAAQILSEEALAFLAGLHRAFEPRRRELIAARAERQKRLDAGELLDFLPETAVVRDGDWVVSPAPADLQDRRVEITGPTTPKMVINALNSGARGFMADLEDSNSPTWGNMVGGQASLYDAVRRTLEWDAPDGREYRLGDDLPTLLVRPRGWHLTDKHLLVDGDPIAGGLMDAGLYLFHNGGELLARGSGPYFYVPKMQSHLEARLWAGVFDHALGELGLPADAVSVTALIETLPAAFEMDEILYELRNHSPALNAGRWDYIFSMIKSFRQRPEFVLPERTAVTMTVPFMRAYTELLVKTCHRRGAHAMGGMAAFLPSRTDESQNSAAMEKIATDKGREADDGFDGTWVAHPDFVGAAMEQFDRVLGERPNQVERLRDDVEVSAADLLDAASAGSQITEAGLRANVNIGIQYISAWLRGNGAAAIYGLMEDAATAEISRSQVWQWIRHGATLDDGTPITRELVERLEVEELAKIRSEVGEEWFDREGRAEESRGLFEDVALADGFVEFLTLPAYEHLP